MKINKLISAVLSAVVLISSGVYSRPSEADAAQTYTVTFLDFDRKVMFTQKVEAGGNIDYASIDTSVLHSHVDAYTEREFYGWSSTPTTVNSDITIQALWRTATISLDSLPKHHRVFASDKNISRDGMKVTITITHQLPEFTIDGEFKTVSEKTDISNSCTITPSTVDAAFKNGSHAEVKIYPVGTSQAIGSYEVYDYRYLGDVNSSGTVDAVDASMVLTSFVNSAANKDYEDSAEFIRRADVNFDGKVDSRDASAILSFYTNSKLTFDDIVDFKDLP